jgi:hypothetical protein
VDEPNRLLPTENSIQEALVAWAKIRVVPPIGRLRSRPQVGNAYDHFGLAPLKEEGTIWKEFWYLIDFMYAVPNGVKLGGRSRGRYMNALKRRGLKDGVSDLVIAYPVEPYHGMYLELKAHPRSKITDEQHDWRHLMDAVGYYACVGIGFDDSLREIQSYLSGTTGPRR